MFNCITKINKEKGLGEIESYPSMEDPDIIKLANYFKTKLSEPPDALILQQTMIFYIKQSTIHVSEDRQSR